MMAPRSANLARAAGLVDQGLSSISNLLLALLVARYSTVGEFGVFALATAVYWLGLGAGRAIVGDPLLIGAAGPDRERVVFPLYASAGVALIGGAVLVGGGSIAGERLFVVMGLALLPLLVQDALRYVFFSCNQPAGALALDAVWIAVQVAAIPVVLTWLDGSDPAVWVACWAAGATVSAFVGVLWLRPAWSPRGFAAWVGITGRVGGGFLTDFVITTGAQQLTLFLLPLVSSLSVVAALKTAQVVSGPLNVLMNAAAVVLLPVISSSRRAGDVSRGVRLGGVAATVLFSVGITYCVIVSLLLPYVGEATLGRQWENSQDVIPLVCLQTACIGLIQGAVLTLRGLHLVSQLLVTRLIVTPINIFSPLIGAALGGDLGLAWGMVISALVTAALWWVIVRRASAHASLVEEHNQ